MTNPSRYRYVFDTSAFIQGWHEHYPISALPSVWALIGAQIDSGTILVPEAVKTELQRQNDGLWKWFSPHRRSVFPHQPIILEEVQELLNRYPTLTKPKGNRMLNEADPHVVACAEHFQIPIITYEEPLPGNSSKVKMGLLCRDLNIQMFKLGFYLGNELTPTPWP